MYWAAQDAGPLLGTKTPKHSSAPARYGAHARSLENTPVPPHALLCLPKSTLNPTRPSTSRDPDHRADDNPHYLSLRLRPSIALLRT